MRRHRKSKHLNSSAQERIERLLDSPLHELAVNLKSLTDVDYEQNVEFVTKVLERLPEELNRNFYFNAWIIQSIVQSWSDNSSLNSGMIIPTHYDEWAYERITIPTISPVNSSFTVSFIYIPFEVNEIPSLLDYPWLCHELGHYLFSLPEHKQMLIGKFHPYLEEVISSLKKMSISDRGLAKIRSQATIDEIDNSWKQSKWVEELAIDVITLWACGPAYLAAFEDAHEDLENPFVIEPSHPPVELRTRALLHAAQKLSWDKHLKELERMRQSWYKKIPSSVRNKYESLRNLDLVTQCVAAALNFCESVRIPCLTMDDLNIIRMNLQPVNDFANGVELIVAAWLVYNENAERYDEWEKTTFDKLSGDIFEASAK